MSFNKGDRVKHLGKSEWGVGQVLNNISGHALWIYFVKVGEKKLDPRYSDLVEVSGKEADQPLLDVINKVNPDTSKHHNVYVVELNQSVLHDSKFHDANPHYDKKNGYPCVYVGLTGLSPEERFKNHKRGYKSAKYVERYGIHLLESLYKCFNPMDHDDAKKMEGELAIKLMFQGYAVWQN
tara:strand:+ start:352 stop:894 length:543 start_codon:yes stop_codon:yes gene_type:complete